MEKTNKKQAAIGAGIGGGGLLFWLHYKFELLKAQVKEQNRTIEMMEKDLKKLRSENARLKKELKKAQSVKGEENN